MASVSMAYVWDVLGCNLVLAQQTAINALKVSDCSS